ncbi:MAG: hypothetical protein ACREA0_09635 [bacterium]
MEMLEHLENEYMSLAEASDPEAIEFAMASRRVNQSVQAVVIGLIAAGSNPSNAGVALWARCARHAFLDVLAAEAAPEWARRRREEASAWPEVLI